jgi:Rieske Fe-S protein
MERRDFLKVTAMGAVVVCSPALLQSELRAADGRLYKSYERVLLTDADANPLNFTKLAKEQAYIFNYPFRSTPVMMIKLKDKTARDITLKSAKGETYIWKGGVGATGSLVAYSAICSHQLSHPTPDYNPIAYSGQKKTMSCDKKGMIVCASHLSAFDPKQGAKQIAGPANEALASVVLEVDKKGQIWAVGVLGPDKFHDFFKTFKSEFKEHYGGKRKAKKRVTEEAEAQTIENYSTDVVLV